MSSAKTNAVNNLANLQTSTSASLASHSTQIQQQLQNLNSTSSAGKWEGFLIIFLPNHDLAQLSIAMAVQRERASRQLRQCTRKFRLILLK